MSDDKHFSIVGDAIGPQPWMQYRNVATVTAESVSKSYGVTGGGNKNDPIHDIDIEWTNTTPITQWVYGMVTRGGASVALQARSRGFLLQKHAVDVTTSKPSSFDMVEASRFGIGGDYGKGGILAIGTGFAMSEIRQNSNSIPLAPEKVGWWSVDPGETFYGRVELSFVTLFWENTLIDGGDAGTESTIISGDTRVDLYAVGAPTAPPERLTPTVVGHSHGIAVTSNTTVNVPAGTAVGDILIATVANQWGLITDITPVQAGWTQVHSRDGGWQNVHGKVYWRVATDSEPASYSFRNGLIAEEIVHLVSIRNASDALDDGWQFASRMSKRWWQRDTVHIAPSIDRNGQALMCVSFIPFARWQAPMSQASPSGMTELRDDCGVASMMASAWLASPPRPTGDRAFVPSAEPVWAGLSVVFSVLIPGRQP